MPETIQRGSLVTPAWRWLAATLLALAAVNFPFSLIAVLVMHDPPVTPGMLFRSLAIFSGLPAGAAWAMLRFLRASIEAREGALRLERPGMRIDLPANAIEAVLPWRVPLPGTGLSLRLAGGKVVPHAVLTPNPDRILDLLGELGSGVGEAARRHPTVVYARARARRRPATVARLLLEFAGFATVPTAILFNLHQQIAYGGTLGQYYVYGLEDYLITLAIYWTTVTLYLVLYASIWRGLAEVAALAAAWLAPHRADGVRRAAERLCSIAYYAGVPLILLVRFLG
jgi:hypothetical protein